LLEAVLDIHWLETALSEGVDVVTENLLRLHELNRLWNFIRAQNIDGRFLLAIQVAYELCVLLVVLAILRWKMRQVI
jgi:hypothetical protein